MPYADGQIGMYGGSYFGLTQWAAAIEQPPALKALAPFITWSDPLDGVSYRGGAFELGLMANWHLQQGLDILVRRHRGDRAALGAAVAGLVRDLDAMGTEGYESLPLSDLAPHRRHDVAPAFFDSVAAPMDRDYCDPWTIVGKHERVQVPTFNIGGWYDLFVNGTIANFVAMRARGVPSKLLIGPWSHVNQRNPFGERSFGFAAQAALIDLKADLGGMQVRWFDHWLKGVENGVMDEPPIKLFVMGANVWRDEQEWPLARAVEMPYYLRADGALSPEPPGAESPDRYEYDPANPVPTLGGPILMSPEYPPGPYDHRAIEARDDVLTYTSAPLDRDTEVTGPIRVHLWATSSAPDTDFVARLTDVFPDGRSYNLTDGIVRARYREFAQGAAPSPIEPGRPYEYTIDLWATSNVFKAGHRLRVQVTSSSFPRWDRNPNTGHPFGADAELRIARQEILHDAEHPSRIVLPLVPA